MHSTHELARKLLAHPDAVLCPNLILQGQEVPISTGEPFQIIDIHENEHGHYLKLAIQVDLCYAWIYLKPAMEKVDWDKLPGYISRN
jgi:hypothetical protein